MNNSSIFENIRLQFNNFENEVCNHLKKHIENDTLVCDDCGIDFCNHNSESQHIDGILICTNCGEEIKEISYEKEWRYYGANDTKTSGNPSRCHIRKDITKSIFPYVEGKSFEHSILANANEKYIKIKDETHRGKNNKAIITACIYSAYLDEREPKTTLEIGKEFGLNKKNISHGFDIFYTYFPEYKTIYIKPSDLLRRVMIKIGLDISHYKRIKTMCEYIQNIKSDINRSTPQSVCCGMVYLYLCLDENEETRKAMGITKSKYTKMVGMSDITITKICKIAIEIMNIKDIKI